VLLYKYDGIFENIIFSVVLKDVGKKSDNDDDDEKRRINLFQIYIYIYIYIYTVVFVHGSKCNNKYDNLKMQTE
jgi:hypothetical protein